MRKTHSIMDGVPYGAFRLFYSVFHYIIFFVLPGLIILLCFFAFPYVAVALI